MILGDAGFRTGMQYGKIKKLLCDAVFGGQAPQQILHLSLGCDGDHTAFGTGHEATQSHQLDRILIGMFAVFLLEHREHLSTAADSGFAGAAGV